MIRIDTNLDLQGIATISLVSPEVANAIGPNDVAMLVRIIEGYQDIDSGARALILTGSGGFFSAGANLDTLKETANTNIEQTLRSLIKPLEQSLSQGRLPTIAAINGAAIGGAVGIALLCDIVVAAQSAKFVLPFARLGILPDTGLTYLLPRLVGEGRARAIAFTCCDISAEQAERWGMIYATYSDQSLMSKAQALAKDLANAPDGVFYSIRQAFIKARDNTLSDQIDLECKLQAQAVQSEAFQRAVAFISKQKPQSSA